MADTFVLIGEVRRPPVRTRGGRYKEVYEAVEACKDNDGLWVALTTGEPKAIAAIRNAIGKVISEDLAYSTQMHEEEDGDITLYVKYDSEHPRPARKARASKPRQRLSVSPSVQDDEDDAAVAEAELASA